ncbi:MAG TPA: histidine kinase [Streptosporangiaceae bacterium]|nr:histidine kinase [Streptosporangiaceae bacterium]
MVTTGPPPSPTFNRIAVTASAAVVVVLTGGVMADLPGRSAVVIAGAIAVLLISCGCVAWVVLRHSVSDLQATIGLVVAGAGGAVLTLLPGGPGFVIVCLAMAGLGMRLVPIRAIICGLVVFAAVNLAIVLTGSGVSLPALASEDVGVAFIFAVGAFTRSSRISQEKARAAQARAEELLEQLRASQLAQAQAAAVNERARLAREIHDILAHALSGLVLSLDTMELLGRQGADEETMTKMGEQVARAQRIARDGLADTRRAIAALRGEELPGPALLDQLVQETSAATGIKAVLAVTGEQRPLPPEIGLAVYRTAQEALVNTAKYAGPGARAKLSLHYGTDAVELAVQDERTAEAAPAGPAGLTFGGYGLTGMRERAELLGGKLTAGPTEAGFGVELRLPADPVTS